MGKPRLSTVWGAAVLRSAFSEDGEIKLPPEVLQSNDEAMEQFLSDDIYSQLPGRCIAVTTGSRAEGFAMEADHGYTEPDHDVMYMYMGIEGFHITSDSQQTCEERCNRLVLDASLSKPGFCRVRIEGDINVFNTRSTTASRESLLRWAIWVIKAAILGALITWLCRMGYSIIAVKLVNQIEELSVNNPYKDHDLEHTTWVIWYSQTLLQFCIVYFLFWFGKNSGTSSLFNHSLRLFQVALVVISVVLTLELDDMSYRVIQFELSKRECLDMASKSQQDIINELDLLGERGAGSFAIPQSRARWVHDEYRLARMYEVQSRTWHARAMVVEKVLGEVEEMVRIANEQLQMIAAMSAWGYYTIHMTQLEVYAQLDICSYASSFLESISCMTGLAQSANDVLNRIEHMFSVEILKYKDQIMNSSQSIATLSQNAEIQPWFDRDYRMRKLRELQQGYRYDDAMTHQKMVDDAQLYVQLHQTVLQARIAALSEFTYSGYAIQSYTWDWSRQDLRWYKEDKLFVSQLTVTTSVIIIVTFILTLITSNNFYLARPYVSLDGYNYVSHKCCTRLFWDVGLFMNRPAGPSRKSIYGDDFVSALMCTAPPPGINKYISRRRNGPWPQPSSLARLAGLPCVIVPTGHPATVNKSVEWRISWSLHELQLANDMEPWVKMGYRAFKYCVKAAINRHGSSSQHHDGQSNISSYHLKTTLLWELEKADAWNSNDPYMLYLSLIQSFSMYLKCRFMPQYFKPDCNLFETVSESTLDITQYCVTAILADPLKSIILSPTYPSQLFGGWRWQGHRRMWEFLIIIRELEALDKLKGPRPEGGSEVFV